MSGVDKDLPIVIDIDDKITALECEYTKENIVKYTLMSLTSDVGEISNCASGYLNKSPKSKKWIDTYKNNVCLLSVINGKEIDYAKTGVKWKIPRVIAKNSKPLPYFLKYKYENMKKFNTAPSNMNILAWNIEKWERTLYHLNKKNTFNLLFNENIPFNEEKYNKIIELHNKFKMEYGYLKANDRILRNVNHPEHSNMVNGLSMWNIKNTRIDFTGLYDAFKEQALKICSDEQELANYAVKIVYELYPKKDKKFAWTVTEDGLIKNIKPDNINFNIRETNNREGVEYLGKWYKLEELV